jgi:hypothetical protein
MRLPRLVNNLRTLQFARMPASVLPRRFRLT